MTLNQREISLFLSDFTPFQFLSFNTEQEKVREISDGKGGKVRKTKNVDLEVIGKLLERIDMYVVMNEQVGRSNLKAIEGSVDTSDVH